MKNFKRKHFGFLFMFLLILVPILYIPFTHLTVVSFTSDGLLLKPSTIDLPSNYSVTQSVTYDVEINMTLTHTYAGAGANRYYFKMPRLDEHGPNSSLTEDCAPFQESELLYTKVTGSDDTPWIEQDRFNNSYDVFNTTTITNGNEITLDQNYRITVNEVKFGNLLSLDITMDDYDVHDEIFDLYCNNTEQYYERDDAGLIAKSNEIAGAYTNPARKAYEIAKWVDANLNYNDAMPVQEMGALWAFNQVPKQGDCSEFSSLMVTLLRIQGIPARKVGGYMLSSSSDFEPSVGYTKTYIWTNTEVTLPGHAWVEYYIPGVGWVSCEPQLSSTYKTSSYLRFINTLGAWITIPDWEPSQIVYRNYSEYNVLFESYSAGFDFDYSFKFTVIDTDFIPGIELEFFITIAIIVGVIALVAIVIVVIIKKTSRTKY